MKLLPLDTPELLDRAAYWLAQKENYQWLDFGNGRQLVSPALLKIMAQAETRLMRVYTAGREDNPIGIVGLNDLARSFKTGTLWGVVGERSFPARGSASSAASRLLTLAFSDLGLHTVTTWVVEHSPWLRTVERLNFRFIGRQRQRHFIDGRPYDRLLFDLLAEEHREVEINGEHRSGKTPLETAGGAE